MLAAAQVVDDGTTGRPAAQMVVKPRTARVVQLILQQQVYLQAGKPRSSPGERLSPRQRA
jgi:hypothetical protein